MRLRDVRARSRLISFSTAATLRPDVKISRTVSLCAQARGDLAARGLQRSEVRGLAVGEVFGVLQERPAGVLERSRRVAGAGRAQLGPVPAADLV